MSDAEWFLLGCKGGSDDERADTKREPAIRCPRGSNDR
jgi:hypothetical protein